MHSGSSKNLAANLEKWALESENWAVHGRLQTYVADACAADMYYHLSYITELKNLARAARLKAEKAERACNDDPSSPYDPLVLSLIIITIIISMNRN